MCSAISSPCRASALGGCSLVSRLLLVSPLRFGLGLQLRREVRRRAHSGVTTRRSREGSRILRAPVSSVPGRPIAAPLFIVDSSGEQPKRGCLGDFATRLGEQPAMPFSQCALVKHRAVCTASVHRRGSPVADPDRAARHGCSFLSQVSQDATVVERISATCCDSHRPRVGRP